MHVCGSDNMNVYVYNNNDDYIKTAEKRVGEKQMKNDGTQNGNENWQKTKLEKD